MGEVEQSKPDFSKPKDVALQHLYKERHHLRQAPLAFCILLGVGAALGYFFAWKVVLESKEASIQALQISAQDKQSRLDFFQKDNERLTKENVELKTSITDRSTPLKKRTLILSGQLLDFAATSATNSDYLGCYTEYDNRFSQRIFKLIEELDEHGEHSSTLSANYNALFGMPSPQNISQRLQIIGKELNQLAANLKE